MSASATTTAPRLMVRCRHAATTIAGLAPPNDTIHLRVYYPAAFSGTDSERLTGTIPADPTCAPWPVLIVLPGINVPPEGYRWLAERLAPLGIATVLYTHIAEVSPGVRGISPGLDLTALVPSTYGNTPSANALAPIRRELLRLNDDPTEPIAGLLDLSRIYLFGHSAGGTVALENARTDWLPGLCGVASYAGHTMPAGPLGYPAGTVLSIDPAVPVLMLAGTADGVIARSADRYGATPTAADDPAGAAHDPVTRSFREGMSRNSGDSWLVWLEGGTHVVITHPADTTTARGFLDPPSDPATDCAIRDVVATLLAEFIGDGRAGAVDVAHGRFEETLATAQPTVASWERR
jgi:dienelactone hydrolase